MPGVSSTARLITGAALIIIAVFAGFARGDLVMFQQMGFGVAVSLLIAFGLMAMVAQSMLRPLRVLRRKLSRELQLDLTQLDLGDDAFEAESQQFLSNDDVSKLIVLSEKPLSSYLDRRYCK